METKIPLHAIIEDLLPLYQDGLLNQETTAWLEEQIRQDQKLQQLVHLSAQTLTKEELGQPSVDHDRAFKTIQRKLSAYQMIFVALSFLLAIYTSILNESFGFILSYTILGFVTYLFYKDFKLVLLLSFVPIFLWFVGDSIAQIVTGGINPEVTLAEYIMHTLIGGMFITALHAIFALIGSVIGLLVFKMREDEER